MGDRRTACAACPMVEGSSEPSAVACIDFTGECSRDQKDSPQHIHNFS